MNGSIPNVPLPLLRSALLHSEWHKSISRCWMTAWLPSVCCVVLLSVPFHGYPQLCNGLQYGDLSACSIPSSTKRKFTSKTRLMLGLETSSRARGQFATVSVLISSSLVSASSWTRPTLRPREADPDHVRRPRTSLFGHYKCTTPVVDRFCFRRFTRFYLIPWCSLHHITSRK